MPDVPKICRILGLLARSCATSGDMSGYSTHELQMLRTALGEAANTNARIENELARREGVAKGWIPAPTR